MREEQRESGLRDMLRGMMEQELTPCVTLAVMRNGEVVYSFVEGRSRLDGDAAIAVDDTTRFNIGSVTKPVTASLLVKLAEMGLVTLDDPVKRYIPEYPFDVVTLSHLLMHTAGYDETLDRGIGWPRSAPELGAYFELIYGIRELKYPPGTTCHYFTHGYAMLMDIIQRVTSSTIEQFARESLFEPLGMNATTFEVSGLKEGSFVLPWKRVDPDRFSFLRHTPPTGESGLYSTALDMARFGNLFLSDGIHGGRRVFSTASIDMMLAEATGGRFSRTPAFWRKGDGPFRNAFGDLSSPAAVCHPGFSGTLLGVDPTYRLAFALLTNSNDVHDDYSVFRRVFNAVTAAFA